MKKILYIIIGVLILTGVLLWGQSSKTPNVPTSADNAPPGTIHNLPVPDAVSAVKAKAAKQFNVDEGLVIVMTAFAKDWPDSCIGVYFKDTACATVITPGYAVTVQISGKLYTYHTNSDGSIIFQKK